MAACQQSASPTPPAPIAPATRAAASQPASAQKDKAQALGPLTEAEFAALHKKKEGASAKLFGEAVEVGGQQAYLSLPDGEGPFPGVLVIHEWWGLNVHVKHYADRLAAEGYAALAIDLYEGKQADGAEMAMKYMKSVDAEAAGAVVKAGVSYLKTNEKIKAAKLASIGWCFGGRWSLNTALMTPELDAAVIYYGPPETNPKKLSKIKAKVLAFYGEKDPSIPLKSVKAFERGLTKAHVTGTIHTYPAGHAFANPSGANYVAEHAEDAWKKATAFLKENLRG